MIHINSMYYIITLIQLIFIIRIQNTYKLKRVPIVRGVNYISIKINLSNLKYLVMLLHPLMTGK